MTLLLVDIGNTRVKWSRLVDGRMGKQNAAANSGWKVADYARRVIGRGWKPAGSRIVISSVAGAPVNRLLVAAARSAGAPVPQFVESERSAAGITTAYLEPWRLGVDRFVAAIGAHHLACGNPVCIASIGTAMTFDLVDESGRHRGGAIVPGPALMVDSLLRYTNGIRKRATGGPRDKPHLFARTTREAIAQGSLHAAAAFIDRAVVEAHKALNQTPLVLLTGGGAAAVQPLLRSRVVGFPDLVLHGLAVWSRAP